MDRSPEELAEEVRSRLLPDLPPGGFDPVRRWDHLGRLLEALEERGCYLMTNSVADPGVRRMASFHRVSDRGFPCVGTSGWGEYATLGGAVLRAAHDAVSAGRT